MAVQARVGLPTEVHKGVPARKQASSKSHDLGLLDRSDWVSELRCTRPIEKSSDRTHCSTTLMLAPLQSRPDATESHSNARRREISHTALVPVPLRKSLSAFKISLRVRESAPGAQLPAEAQAKGQGGRRTRVRHSPSFAQRAARHSSMESSLVFDKKSQSLGLAFKERLRESENEVELKVSGLLNTKTGRLDGVGSLRKFVFLGGQLPGRNPYLRPAAEKRRTR